MCSVVQAVQAQVKKRLAILTDDPTSSDRWVCWLQPPRSVYKANFNAAGWEDGKATISCVVRDKAGALRLVAGWSCDNSGVLEAESRAA